MAYKTETLTAKLVEAINACNAADRAIAKAGTFRQDIAEYALAAIRNGELTLEQFKEEMLTAWRGKLSAKAAKEITSLNHCGSTYKGIYHAIARVAKAGKPAMARVADKKEPLSKVASECTASQKQKAGKRGNRGNGKANKPITLVAALDGLEKWLDAAIADPKAAKELAANPRIAGLVGKLAALEKAAATKATRAKRQRKSA